MDAVLARLISCRGAFLDLLNILALFYLCWELKREMCLVEWQALSWGGKFSRLPSFSSLLDTFLKNRADCSLYWLGCFERVDTGLYI